MLTLHSPAKINWFLKVLGRRPDGYHEIRSVIQRIDLQDTIIIEKDDSGIHLDSEIDVPVEENLVYKAAVLLGEHTGVSAGARITLRKRIPIGAGLGGGSSNAATTLAGLNILWGTGLSHAELEEVAEGIGSDVPFFLNGSIALVEGRGERVTPIVDPPVGINLLVVKPRFGVATGEAYAGLRTCSGTAGPSVTELLEVLKTGRFKELNGMIGNDLEGPVFGLFPVLKDIKERLLGLGASAALLSGSGSSLFGVFPSREAALKASGSFADLWHVVTRTI